MAVEISRDECKNYLLQFVPQIAPQYLAPPSIRQIFNSWWKSFVIRYIEGAADTAQITQVVQARLNADPNSLSAFDLSWFSAKEIEKLQLNEATAQAILTHVKVDKSQKVASYPRPFEEKQIVLARLAIQASRNPQHLPIEHQAPSYNNNIGQGQIPAEIEAVLVQVEKTILMSKPPRNNKKLKTEAHKIAKTLPSPANRRNYNPSTTSGITPGRLLAAEFRQYLEVTPPSMPALHDVQTLVANLNYAQPKPAKRLLESLSLMAQLFLYELISDRHKELLITLMVESYNVLEPEGDQSSELRQEIFRSYLMQNKRDMNVNGRYVALLERLPAALN